jgi:hypothetical protein
MNNTGNTNGQLSNEGQAANSNTGNDNPQQQMVYAGNLPIPVSEAKYFL